ncbi:DNA-binding response regulator [Roseovarius faecimaris]|uniref:DNA-binding response regulator n=1 Tax=Roseovarius faecimaris TaxID=2494550 RepID=A0A6I6IMP8_9RHOB|nr:response regulator transcription factor [Roseovarius faecimaris]QGX98390.1 DNA-binding response regulator [Roseovarius faecimaris]
MQTLLLADDHDLVRETLAEYLRQQGGFIVICARTFEEAVDLYAKHDHFDLILLDYSMPGMDALTGLERMRELADCPVALLSGTAPREIARRALKRGAAGFLPKTLAPVDMVAAVHAMLAGEVYLPIDFLAGRGGTPMIVSLTPRETDVLQGIVEGKSNKEIARDLDIQEVTVKLHLKTLSRKLGARNRTHAAMLARDQGLC